MNEAPAVPVFAEPEPDASGRRLVQFHPVAPAEPPAMGTRSEVRVMVEAAAGEPAFAMAVTALILHRHSAQTEFDIGVRVLGVSGSRRVAVSLSPQASFKALRDALATALDDPRAPGDDGCNVVLCLDQEPLASAAPLVFALRSDGELMVDYDAHVIDPAWARDLADQWAIVAAQAAAAPVQSLDAYTLLTPRAAAVLADPALPIVAPAQEPLVDTVLAWCARTPDAPAIAFDDRVYAYSELGVLVEGLARALRAAGHTPGEVVAVTGVRSFGLVAAMLAAWRAGGVLLMLDPRLPRQRREAMLEQSKARWRLQVGSNGDDVALPATATCTPDGNLSHGLPYEGEGSGWPALAGDAPAYVFFTSGSTGTPKAVLGRHAGLAHFLHWQRTTFRIAPADRASQLTALSFDVVLRDTFLALSGGATLCIPPEASVLDPEQVMPWLQSSGITTLHIVPSLARLWLDLVPSGVTLPALRRVFFAGEPLTDVLVRRWREAFGSRARLVNLYGPTETTLAKCWYEVPAEPWAGVQPIGQPLPQTQVLILDRMRRRCGLNEPGEIAIRTPFRTAGYLENPAANAAAFVRNPARDDAHDLVYLTGDSGRWRSDGLLEIRGRIDNQVKIRGVRIEPAEIEACIARHPAVAAAVVTVRSDTRGDKFLVAYVVARDLPPMQVREQAFLDTLRAFVRERLPDTMVPSAFVRLDRLPLNPNGKVDKRALPAPDLAPDRATEHAPLETDLQRRIARVWGELLHVADVGLDDNFFDIGGHSLLAIQAVRAVERETGHACSLPDLFTAPTVRALAALLPAGRAARTAPLVIPLRSEGSDRPVFCICGIHLYQQLADELAPRMPVIGIFLPSEEAFYAAEPGALPAPSVEEMAAEYRAAVRRVQPHGPYRLVGVSFGGVLAFEIAQQFLAAGERVECLAMLDSMLPRALRRDWLRWAVEHVTRMRRGGWHALLARLQRRIGVTPATPPNASAHPSEESERLESIRQSIYRAATRRYEPRHYPAQALLVRASDPGFFKSDIADRTYGWGSLVGDLRIADVQGDHLGILRAPNVRGLAAAIAAEIGREAALPRTMAAAAAPVQQPAASR